MPVLHVCHEVSSWPTKRAWEQIVDIWPILLEFGPINDLLLFVTSCWWCRSLAKVTNRVKIEKSKLFFVIPKTIYVIPYLYNFLISYPLSLKLFCQLSLIPKTPNRASEMLCSVLAMRSRLTLAPIQANSRGQWSVVRQVVNSCEDAVCYVSWMASHAENNSTEFTDKWIRFYNLVFSSQEVYPRGISIMIYGGSRTPTQGRENVKAFQEFEFQVLHENSLGSTFCGVLFQFGMQKTFSDNWHS